MRNLAIVALGAALLVFVPQRAGAYGLMGTRWSRDEIPVSFTVNESLTQDLPDAEALAAITTGFTVWNALECSGMRWRYGGRTRQQGWGVDDGENVVTFRESGWDDSSGALAITLSQWGGWGGALMDADIKFNGVHHSWANYGDAQVPRGWAYDLSAVAAHEVGHALGLDHSGVAGATMWPSVGPADTEPRTLSADDIAGVCELYDTGAPRPSPEDLPAPGTEVEPSPPGPPTSPPRDVPARVAGFDEDCTGLPCDLGLVCISDGTSSYCARRCVGAVDCGDAHTCTRTAAGNRVCARGPVEGGEVAGKGEACGPALGCAAGLTCVSQKGVRQCVGPCVDGTCEAGAACAQLESGALVCVPADDGAPTLGEPCDPAGLCAPGLLCLEDRGLRYCTRSCAQDDCGFGVTCVPIEPSGSACRFDAPPGFEGAPSPEVAPVPDDIDAGGVGADCVIEPGRPACAVGLACVDTLVLDGVLVAPGYCTVGCDPTHCCPDGFGCTVEGGRGGRCRRGAIEAPALACDPTATAETNEDPQAAPSDKADDPLGCAGVPWLLGPLALCRRRRRAPVRFPKTACETQVTSNDRKHAED